MFEHWLKMWRDWMFWWLPGADARDDSRPDAEATRAPAPGQSESEPAAGGTAATARPTARESAAPAAPSDDLTVIKGIGPTTARKLETLGIRTFADLAAADPEDLATRLASRPVTAERVRTWIAEAKTRAA